jgi:hypothetical protein
LLTQIGRSPDLIAQLVVGGSDLSICVSTIQNTRAWPDSEDAPAGDEGLAEQIERLKLTGNPIAPFDPETAYPLVVGLASGQCSPDISNAIGQGLAAMWVATDRDLQQPALGKLGGLVEGSS